MWRHLSAWWAPGWRRCGRLLNMFSDARRPIRSTRWSARPAWSRRRRPLHATSPLQLVDSVELHRTGLRGSVTVQFAIDQFVQIYGEPMLVMEGPRRWPRYAW